MTLPSAKMRADTAGLSVWNRRGAAFAADERKNGGRASGPVPPGNGISGTGRGG